jgi:hypothetical protein
MGVLSCNNQLKISESNQTANPQLNPTLRIAIPQGSGEIFVNYEIFEILNDTLFVIDRIMQLGQLDVDSIYRYDTTAFYKIDKDLIIELENVISAIDTLGNHRPKGYYSPMGWPRFSISASIIGKKLDGSISNCYRENIFRLVDFMNKCYPKGKIIEYNEQKLIELERQLTKSND